VATTTMTKTYFEDLGRIAESNAKSAQESTRIVTDYWIASRERNAKVTREITRTITEGMRRRADANEELTGKIFEILEERDEPHKRFFGQWAEAFASVPFDYARQTVGEAQKSANRGVSPTSVNGAPDRGLRGVERGSDLEAARHPKRCSDKAV
jgi:hypothetical protein